MKILFVLLVFFLVSCEDPNREKEVVDETTDSLLEEVLDSDPDVAEGTDSDVEIDSNPDVDIDTDPDVGTDSDNETSDEENQHISCEEDLNIIYSKAGLDDVAKDITIEVFANYLSEEGSPETINLDTEGEITVGPPDGLSEEYGFSGLMTAENFFTGIFNSNDGGEITVPVDLDPIMPEYLNGRIYYTSHWGLSSFSGRVDVYDENDKCIGFFNTFEGGKFVIKNAAKNARKLKKKNEEYDEYEDEGYDGPEYYEISVDGFKNNNTIETYYYSYEAKPNIYLYPETETDLSVKLDLVKGGEIVVSIPDYGDGWNVRVAPDGIIDDKYEFLFYESFTPDLYQYSAGWTVDAREFEKFFTENLKEYGFQGREINDFIDWWIPRFDKTGCFYVHPQLDDIISKTIQLNISQTPDSVQRLFYVIRKAPGCDAEIQDVAIKPFERKGFTVMEWGVINR
jgi:hypothetical protein